MSERKIVEYKIVSAITLEDNGCKGLNTLANELIKEGFEPHGDIKYHTSVYYGQNNFVSTSYHYTKEFVKYEQ